MKVIPLVRSKEVWDDGTIVEVVIWELPEPVLPCSHKFKYRLFFDTSDQGLVRYDNERGKGDHRHLGGKEEPYLFLSLERLLDDFERDMRARSGS
jgi:hypothetical protein